jgi:hypothetical protein
MLVEREDRFINIVRESIGSSASKIPALFAARIVSVI